MLQERYVSFEQAKILREKGFPQSLYFNNFSYNQDGVLKTGISTLDKDVYKASTLSLVQKWLRDKKKIYIDVITETNGKWENGVVYTFSIMMEGLDMVFGEHYDDYDDALSDAIDNSLKLLDAQ